MNINMRLAIFLESLEFIAVFLILPIAVFLAAQYLASLKGNNKFLSILPTFVAISLLIGCCFLYLYGIYTMSAETRYFASLLMMIAGYCIAGSIAGLLIATKIKKKKNM